MVSIIVSVVVEGLAWSLEKPHRLIIGMLVASLAALGAIVWSAG